MWDVPKQTIYTVLTKAEKGRVIVQCSLTDKEYAEDTLSDLQQNKPDYYHYIVENDLYRFDE